MHNKEHIGFVGAGLMGRGMAEHLHQAGHPLTLYVHRNRTGIEPLLAQGCDETGSLTTLAARGEGILLCVRNPDAVRAVVTELAPALRPGQLVLDATTSNPETSRAIATQLAARGIGFADAPVTGGPAEAAAGRLGTLLGCTETDFERARAIVACYSKVVHRVGEVGAGHAAKLLNNFVTQGTTVLLAEAYRRARDVGVDWQALYSVMETGAARSGTLEKMVKPALAGDYDGSRFALRNALKDYRYICEMYAASPRGPSRVAEEIRAVFAAAVEAGAGERYVSALLDPALDPLKTR